MADDDFLGGGSGDDQEGGDVSLDDFFQPSVGDKPAAKPAPQAKPKASKPAPQAKPKASKPAPQAKPKASKPVPQAKPKASKPAPQTKPPQQVKPPLPPPDMPLEIPEAQPAPAGEAGDDEPVAEAFYIEEAPGLAQPTTPPPAAAEPALPPPPEEPPPPDFSDDLLPARKDDEPPDMGGDGTGEEIRGGKKTRIIMAVAALVVVSIVAVGAYFAAGYFLGDKDTTPEKKIAKKVKPIKKTVKPKEAIPPPPDTTKKKKVDKTSKKPKKAAKTKKAPAKKTTKKVAKKPPAKKPPAKKPPKSVVDSIKVLKEKRGQHAVQLGMYAFKPSMLDSVNKAIRAGFTPYMTYSSRTLTHIQVIVGPAASDKDLISMLDKISSFGYSYKVNGQGRGATILVATTFNAGDANKTKNKLVKAGISKVKIRKIRKKTRIHNLKVGPFNNEREAQTAMQKLEALGLEPVVVRVP